VRQPAQHLLAPIMMDNSFRYHSPKLRHARGKPVGHMAAMEWEICASSTTGHGSSDSRKLLKVTE
jgi:hypothetical protein